MFSLSGKKKFEGLVFPQEIVVNDVEYGIDVIFSAKRSSSVVVRDDRLVFRMSSYLSRKQAQEHFAELLKKIYKKVERSGVVRVKTIKDVLEEGHLVFADTIYPVEYTTKFRGVKFVDEKFYVNVKTKPENIERHILRKLIEVYTPRVKSYVLAVNERTYGFCVKDVELKLVNSKWGHCTVDNRLMFNLKLLNAPVEVFDYVIVHELAHILHKNHSQSFWREVSRFCPNYKRIRKMLKDSPPQVFK